MSMKDENRRSPSIETTIANERTAANAEWALYTLLYDHPDFSGGVSKIRKKLKIPPEGFSGPQTAFNWEHASASNQKALREAVKRLLGNFEIPALLGAEAAHFAYDYALCPEIVANSLPPKEEAGAFDRVHRQKEGVRTFRTKKDLEFNKYLFQADTTYLEIYPHTVSRDVIRALKSLRRRSVRVRPSSVTKIEKTARYVWLLSEKGLKHETIAKHANSKFGGKLTYSDVAVYRHRYKKALESLKKISGK